MKISKTQLKEIIKEELETVLSEEDIEEGIFDMFKKKKKPSYEERRYSSWEALDYRDKLAALRGEPIEGLTVPGLRITDDTYPYLYIPDEVRDAWEEDQKVIDAEKRNVAIRRAREEEEARKRGARADADREFAADQKAKKKSGSFGYRGAHGRSGEGSPSAPWDE